MAVQVQKAAGKYGWRRAASAALGFLLLLVVTTDAYGARVKDIASVAGVRSNQLIGYGLVVGLDGSGDQTTQTPFTVQSLRSLMTQLGITIPPGVNPQLTNVAAVMISAELPAFSRPGQTIDVTVSSVGNARSLRGGTLLMAPLKGADGQVYALAQGNVVVGGFGADAAGSSITVNVPSVGRVPNGATVERSVPNPFADGDTVTLNLHTPDFTSATRLAQAINDTMGPGTARPVDAAAVRVNAPRDAGHRVTFVSMLENITLTPGDAPARIIVNSRTGTIVIGSHVRVMPAAVTHGSLTVTISAEMQVSQPAPFSEGETVVVPQATITAEQENNPMFLFQPGVTLSDIVRAVNQVGAAPADLVAILEALKAAGALHAELLVI